MEASDRVRVAEIADVLAEQGFNARLVMDGDLPVLFALGVKKTHSVDLRRAKVGLVIEFWYGYPMTSSSAPTPWKRSKRRCRASSAGWPGMRMSANGR